MQKRLHFHCPCRIGPHFINYGQCRRRPQQHRHAPPLRRIALPRNNRQRRARIIGLCLEFRKRRKRNYLSILANQNARAILPRIHTRALQNRLPARDKALHRPRIIIPAIAARQPIHHRRRIARAQHQLIKLARLLRHGQFHNFSTGFGRHRQSKRRRIGRLIAKCAHPHLLQHQRAQVLLKYAPCRICSRQFLQRLHHMNSPACGFDLRRIRGQLLGLRLRKLPPRSRRGRTGKRLRRQRNIYRRQRILAGRR